MVVEQKPLCLLVHWFNSGCSVEISKNNGSNMGKQVEVRPQSSSLKTLYFDLYTDRKYSVYFICLHKKFIVNILDVDLV